MRTSSQLSLDKDLALHLSEGVKITFETMLGLSPSPMQFQVSRDGHAQGDITGIVSLTQEAMDAVCLISFPSSTIFHVLKKVYGMDFNSLEEQAVQQGVGELANIINGVIKTRMNERGFKLRMGLPNVVIGKAHTVMTQANPSLTIPFEIDKLQFSVTLTIVGELQTNSTAA